MYFISTILRVELFKSRKQSRQIEYIIVSFLCNCRDIQVYLTIESKLSAVDEINRENIRLHEII
jgi:hypothetical protein